MFTEAELRDLLSRDEGQFLEFKSTWDRTGSAPKHVKRRLVRDAIAESVAAFANADGGLLLIGVEDDGAPTGCDYPDEVIEEFAAVPRRRLRPPVSCRVGRLSIAGVEVLAFDVPIAPEAVMIDGNGFPYRVGDASTREPQEVVNERKQAYRRVGCEQRFRAGATLDHLDLEIAGAFLRRTPVGRRPIVEALGHYGLIEQAASEWRITNAALLLFGRPPVLRWHPRAGLRLFRVDGTSRRHGRRRNVTQIGRVDPPLAAAVAEARRMAGLQVRRAEKLNGLYFDQEPEYPDFAWQEAIVNAFAHRDYEHQGREVEVWFYDDRMEVSSPGDLFPPVTLARLRARRPAHATRNPLIVRVLADAGVMRDEGEGVARIFDEMEESALREPEVALDDGVFSISLFNGRVPTGTGGDLPAEDQLTVLRTHFERRRELRNADYRALFGVTRYAAVRELQKLVEAGFLRKIGERRGTRYLPQPALDRRREE